MGGKWFLHFTKLLECVKNVPVLHLDKTKTFPCFWGWEETRRHVTESLGLLFWAKSSREREHCRPGGAQLTTTYHSNWSMRLISRYLQAAQGNFPTQRGQGLRRKISPEPEPASQFSPASCRVGVPDLESYQGILDGFLCCLGSPVRLWEFTGVWPSVRRLFWPQRWGKVFLLKHTESCFPLLLLGPEGRVYDIAQGLSVWLQSVPVAWLGTVRGSVWRSH